MNSEPSAAAETADPRKARPKTEVPLSERVAYTVAAFAALFGRAPIWGYRRVYAGDVKVKEISGQLMVPRAEVDRLTAGADVYSGDTEASERARNRAQKRKVKA